MMPKKAGVKLVPLSKRNVGQLVAVGPESNTRFHVLPQNAEGGQILLDYWKERRANGTGDNLLAYANRWRGPLVGGATYEARGDRIGTAGWVVREYRGQGYGRLIMAAVELEAARQLPEATVFEAEIREENVASQALVAAMGYEDTGRRDRTDRMIFEKPILRP